LYHLVEDDDFRHALAGVATLVKDGGVLLVSDVFVPSDRRTAPHVKRRSLPTYETILGRFGFRYVGREPVYAILGDPAPETVASARQRGLLRAYRAVRAVVTNTPEPIRDIVGAAVAIILMPIDHLARGVLRPGMSLEVALFRREDSSAG
jgi:hypothetical protein